MGLMGCHSLNAKSQATGETQECLAYRAMMTAPMDPLAMQGRVKLEVRHKPPN